MQYKRIFKTTSGNVIGIVEEPVPLDPDQPLEKQRIVKIGVFDPKKGIPRFDANRVIMRLREFVSHSMKGERKTNASDSETQ